MRLHNKKVEIVVYKLRRMYGLVAASLNSHVCKSKNSIKEVNIALLRIMKDNIHLS